MGGGRGGEVDGTEAEGGGSKIKRRSCEKDEGRDREEEEGGQGKTGKVKKSTESTARHPYWHCPAVTRNCPEKMPLFGVYFFCANLTLLFLHFTNARVDVFEQTVETIFL